MNLEPDHYQFTDENQPIAYVLKSKAEAALKEAVAKEREACWQIADDAGLWIQAWEKKYGNVSVADAIKARGAAHD